MSVICGISTYHLIDTSSPCRLIGVELSSARLPSCFLSLTVRAKRPMRSKGAAEGTEGQSKPLEQSREYWTLFNAGQ